MAGNPLILQGVLNRLRGSVLVPTFPVLNITSGFLGKMGIRLALEGVATQTPETMTGMVTSPEPYMPANITIHLLRTQNLGALWRAQLEQQTSALGPVTVVPDTSVWPHYDFQNVSITNIPEMAFDGTNPEFVITLRGTYPINAALFNLT
jgi:hypothetical protein